MAQKQQLETLVVAGQITATSNKVDSKFKQEVPTKTAYISVDEENAEALKEFGLQEYSSKNEETGEEETFFIVKLPAKGVSIWLNKKKVAVRDSSVNTPNFQTVPGLPVGLAILKGENMGNEFYRLTALNVTQKEDIFDIEESNPFE